MKSQNVVFLNIYRYDYTPLGLLCLWATLINDKKFAVEWNISMLEFHASESPGNILEKIISKRPTILAASVYSWNRDMVFSILKRVKDIAPEIFTICGGPDLSFQTTEAIKKVDYLDAAIAGMGEVPFLNLCRLYLQKDRFSSIENLCYRSKDGQVLMNLADSKQRQLFNRDLPSPYQQDIPIVKHGTACMETHRGCLDKCSFCLQAFSYSPFSLKRVFEDIDYLLSNFRNVYITDPNFTSDLKRAKEITRYIAKNNIKKVEFYAELEISAVDEEMAVLLKKANFTRVGVGLQSQDSLVLKNINRPFFNKSYFVNRIELLIKNGIDVEIEVIFGLPSQTPVSFNKTLEFVDELKPHKIKIYCLNIYPETPVMEIAVRDKWLFQKEPPYYLIENQCFSRDDIIFYRRLARFTPIFYQNLAVRLIIDNRKIGFFSFCKEFLKWHQENNNPADSILLSSYQDISKKEWKQLEKVIEDFLNHFLLQHYSGIKEHRYVVSDGMLYKVKGKSSELA